MVCSAVGLRPVTQREQAFSGILNRCSGRVVRACTSADLAEAGGRATGHRRVRTRQESRDADR